MPSSLHQPLDFSRVELRDLCRIETGKRLPVGLALSQDRDPAQAGLRAFENQHLEEMTVVVRGDAPFFIVVRDIQRIAAGPCATLHARFTCLPSVTSDARARHMRRRSPARRGLDHRQTPRELGTTDRSAAWSTRQSHVPG